MPRPPALCLRLAAEPFLPALPWRLPAPFLPVPFLPLPFPGLPLPALSPPFVPFEPRLFLPSASFLAASRNLSLLDFFPGLPRGLRPPPPEDRPPDPLCRGVERGCRPPGQRDCRAHPARAHADGARSHPRIRRRRRHCAGRRAATALLIGPPARARLWRDCGKLPPSFGRALFLDFPRVSGDYTPCPVPDCKSCHLFFLSS